MFLTFLFIVQALHLARRMILTEKFVNGFEVEPARSVASMRSLERRRCWVNCVVQTADLNVYRLNDDALGNV